MKRNTLKIIPMISAISIAVLFFAAPAFAQSLYENPPNDNSTREGPGDYSTTLSVDGTVTSIDADGGVITIRPFIATNVNNDQLTVQIIPESNVYKNGNSVKSSDIEIGDVVTIEYYDDPSGLRAVTVNVE